jgi:hypothetical protein
LISIFISTLPLILSRRHAAADIAAISLMPLFADIADAIGALCIGHYFAAAYFRHAAASRFAFAASQRFRLSLSRYFRRLLLITPFSPHYAIIDFITFAAMPHIDITLSPPLRCHILISYASIIDYCLAISGCHIAIVDAASRR